MAFKSSYQTKSIIESPESLFYDLRNRQVEGLLSHQADVLRTYSKEAIKKSDVAMELPTGSGKTLIGLVAGEYRRRAFQERVVYLCPTNQLVHQVVEEAKNKYGIHARAFTGSRLSYDPQAKAEYNLGEAIAVTNYSSLFNSNPFFYNPNAIILDDAHAAENYIAKHWSLNISRRTHTSIYSQVLEIIREAIPFEQYQRMHSPHPSPIEIKLVEKIPTPYFYSKQEELIPYLDESTKEYSDLSHNWKIIRDHLSGCHLYIDWNSILIRPIIPPTSTHSAFASANQRIYMSATLGLGGELERITGQSDIHRIKAPEGWDKHGVGRRLFFFPGTSLNEEDSQSLVLKLINDSPRTLILVPDQQSADQLTENISSETTKTIYQAKDIELSKDGFTNNDNSVAILANRYDGINLAGDSCRLEIMRGLPSATNLHEKFLETRMSASLLLKDRVRTRIVQAIGRCTRSATDFSTVCILGDDLQDRLLQKENIQLYHPELQAELQFGYEESKRANGIHDFLNMYHIFLDQKSEEWSGADAQIVARREDTIQRPDPLMEKLQSIVSFEIKYQLAIWSKDYLKAFEHANSIATELSGEELKGYRGFWYYLAGSVAWLAAQTDSTYYSVAQTRFGQAANCTSSVTWFRNLVTQSNGIGIEVENNRHLSFLIERLEIELDKMGTSSDRKFNKRATDILNGLNNNQDGGRFEIAHQDLGTLLGYKSENTVSSGGPDPWWIADNDFCLVAEDYTQTDGKNPIPLYKVRQVNDHPNWISENTDGLSTETDFIRVIITPSKKVEVAAISISNNVAYWNQLDFIEWANTAIQVLRTLRLDFTGPGSEQWRLKAIQAYRDAKLDPASIKAILSTSLLKNMETT